MTYIGQQPATTFDAGIQDRFTGLSSNTVTLTHEIAAEEDILVVWNNIVQDKNTYSVGGTGNKTLTLGGTLVSADVVTVYYLNKVMQSVNPTAGSVGAEQINDGIITKAKLADSIDIFAGTSLSAADLGAGVHIKTGDSGGSATSTADEIVVEGSGDMGIQLLGGASSSCGIAFGDSGDSNVGLINYDHANNRMRFKTNDTIHQTISSAGEVTQPLQPSFRVLSADMTNILRNQYVNIQFNSELFDIGSNFDTSTYTFTAPVTGKYFLGTQILFQSVPAAGTYLGVRVETSNHGYWSYLHSLTPMDADATYYHVTTAGVYDMDASDTAYVRLYLNDAATGSNVLDINSGATLFTGMLIG